LRLHSLYLEENDLSDWADVEPLGRLPSLRLLNLNFNQLAAIPAGASASFATLEHLMLRANPISSWASIDVLDSFAALTEARLAELPLISELSGAAARRVVIARLGKLKGLNGSEVRTREREDAERFYLRQIALEYPEGGLPASAIENPPDEPIATGVDEYGRPLQTVAPASAPGGVSSKPPTTLRVPEGEAWGALTKRHPRWASLLVHHGTHVTKTAAAASGGVLANELLEISLRSTSAENSHLPAVSRKLPGGLPLKSLKLIACQLFKVEPAMQQLLYSPPGQDRDIPEPLEGDSSSLADLGVASGGTIVVEQRE